MTSKSELENLMHQWQNAEPTIPLKFGGGGFVPSVNDVLIQTKQDTTAMWEWCRLHAERNKWRKLLPLTGLTATYVFNNESDALAFKLQFPFTTVKKKT